MEEEGDVQGRGGLVLAEERGRRSRGYPRRRARRLPARRGRPQPLHACTGLALVWLPPPCSSLSPSSRAEAAFQSGPRRACPTRPFPPGPRPPGPASLPEPARPSAAVCPQGGGAEGLARGRSIPRGRLRSPGRTIMIPLRLLPVPLARYEDPHLPIPPTNASDARLAPRAAPAGGRRTLCNAS